MCSRSEVNLERALKVRFPDEEVDRVAKLLSEVLEKGRITYQQIDMSEEVKEDVVLFTYTNRLLLPIRSGKTMAWEDRPLTLAPDECYRNFKGSVRREVMCLVTVYIEEEGQKKEVMQDVAWIESRDDELLMGTLLGEEKRLHSKIKSIDLLDNSVMLKVEGNTHGDPRSAKKVYPL